MLAPLVLLSSAGARCFCPTSPDVCLLTLAFLAAFSTGVWCSCLSDGAEASIAITAARELGKQDSSFRFRQVCPLTKGCPNTERWLD